MRSARCGTLSLLLLLLVMSVSSPADAARKIIFYQSGDDIFEAGPLPAPFDKVKKLTGTKAGYKCSIFGIFWAYLHIWDCEAVAFVGNRYMKDAKLAAAIDAKYKGKMKVGLWKKHGRWVFALLIVGVVVFSLLRKKGGDDEEEES